MIPFESLVLRKEKKLGFVHKQSVVFYGVVWCGGVLPELTRHRLDRRRAAPRVLSSHKSRRRKLSRDIRLTYMCTYHRLYLLTTILCVYGMLCKCECVMIVFYVCSCSIVRMSVVYLGMQSTKG